RQGGRRVAGQGNGRLPSGCAQGVGVGVAGAGLVGLGQTDVTEQLPRLFARTAFHGPQRMRFRLLPIVRLRGEARPRQQQGGAVGVLFQPAVAYRRAVFIAAERQAPVACRQGIVPLRGQRLFQRLACGLVPAQRRSTVGVGGGDFGIGPQVLGQRLPVRCQGVAVACLAQHRGGPSGLARGKLRVGQRVVPARRAEQFVGLGGLAGGGQGFGAQGEAARGQRLGGRGVQRHQGVGGAALSQGQLRGRNGARRRVAV